MKIKSAKNGYHSTQRTIYGKVPASEFYGFVLGIAFGYIIGALINMSGVMVVNHSDIAIILCIVGFRRGGRRRGLCRKGYRRRRYRRRR